MHDLAENTQEILCPGWGIFNSLLTLVQQLTFLFPADQQELDWLKEMSSTLKCTINLRNPPLLQPWPKNRCLSCLQLLERQPEVVGKGPAKQKAAGCGIAGKKAIYLTLTEEEMENPILLKSIQVNQNKIQNIKQEGAHKARHLNCSVCGSHVPLAQDKRCATWGKSKTQTPFSTHKYHDHVRSFWKNKISQSWCYRLLFNFLINQWSRTSFRVEIKPLYCTGFSNHRESDDFIKISSTGKTYSECGTDVSQSWWGVYSINLS